MRKLLFFLMLMFPLFVSAQVYNVLHYGTELVINGINIKTQIPDSVGHSPKIHIDAMDEYWGSFIIDISWISYGGTGYTLPIASSSGSYMPLLFLSEDSGRFMINLPGEYYNLHLIITGYAEEGTDSTMFKNWTVTDDTVSTNMMSQIGYLNGFDNVTVNRNLSSQTFYADYLTAGSMTNGTGYYASPKDNYFSQNSYYNESSGTWMAYGSKSMYGNAVLLQTAGKTGKAFNILVDTSIAAFSEQLSFTNLLTVLTDGKTGIGSPNPKELLQVNGNIATSGNNKGIRFNSYDSSGNKFLASGYAAALTLDSTGTLVYSHTSSSGSANASATFSDSSFVIDKDGKIGIGTRTPQSQLSINGDVYAKKVKVTATGWPDYVFEPGYKLPDLNEVERFIQINKHLPGLSSAKEIEKEGNDIGQTQTVLLKKVEELTLYIIEMNKKIDELAKENANLQNKIDTK